MYVIGPKLELSTWTHIVTSYSNANGVRLWVNGTLINSSGSFSYNPSHVSNSLTLGSSLHGIGHCSALPVDIGQFYGMMDELRVYSRELDACEVYQLANPC